jgi:hypothetical protein
VPQIDIYSQEALKHIRHLSVIVGGRGSCTPEEQQATAYTAKEMRDLGVTEVRLEPYKGSPSTYRPYALALGLAALATLLVWLLEGPWVLALAALVKALAAWGMVAESDFATNWMRWLLPKGDSQNAVGFIPAGGPAPGVEPAGAGPGARRVVLCAHVDSHRTPSFYASEKRFTRFRLLVIGAWVGMIVEAVAYGLAAILAWDWVFWIGVVALVQVIALDLCLLADRTPFSPGANDNASGVGLALGLAHHVMEEPLARTEVWLAFTGCEETGASGMAAFLEAHAAQLGDKAVYIILDIVGQGDLTLPTADGLLIKHRIHPEALDLVRRAAAALPGLEVKEQPGLAYTDATLASKQGRIALTVNTVPPAESEHASHWHRMSDTLDKIDPEALAAAHAFTWQLLQDVDRTADRERI